MLPDGCFERPNALRVKMMMSRARAILVSVLPTMLLVASFNCAGSPVCATLGHPGSTLHADGHSRHELAVDNSFSQAMRRWSRRIKAQLGPDGFAPLANLAQSQFASPAQTIDFAALPSASPELARCWQFHWRTAPEPRAPSLVS